MIQASDKDRLADFTAPMVSGRPRRRNLHKPAIRLATRATTGPCVRFGRVEGSSVDLCEKQWLTRAEIRRLAAELAPALSPPVLDGFLDRSPQFPQQTRIDGIVRFKAAPVVSFLEKAGRAHFWTIQPGVLIGPPPPVTEAIPLC